MIVYPKLIFKEKDMKFSFPIDIGFQVLNELIKKDIPYSKCATEEEPVDEQSVFAIDIDVHDDYVDQATDIVNSITGGQVTRSQRWHETMNNK